MQTKNCDRMDAIEQTIDRGREKKSKMTERKRVREWSKATKQLKIVVDNSIQGFSFCQISSDEMDVSL